MIDANVMTMPLLDLQKWRSAFVCLITASIRQRLGDLATTPRSF